MSDEETQRIREEVIRALAEQGADVAAFPDADTALAGGATAPVALPVWDDVAQRAAEAGVVPTAGCDARGAGAMAGQTTDADSENAPQGDGLVEEELTEEELERLMLEAVFAAVRTESASSKLVQPVQWPDAGLVPAHQAADDWEMFVYEYVEEHGAESERAGQEAAPAPVVRTASVAVGVPRAFRTAAEPVESAESVEAAGAAESAAFPVDNPTSADFADADANPQPACSDIVALVGAHSYYLYSRDHMTDAYARWAFLAHEDDRRGTFVECVRQVSRTDPRPMAATALQNEPFNYAAEDGTELWEAVRASGAYPDIDTVSASNGEVFYFSTDFLTPSYAASLAEWDAVERSMFL